MSDPRLDAHLPDGPIAEKWDHHRFAVRLVNPSNRRKFHVIVVATALSQNKLTGGGNLTARISMSVATR